LTKDGGRQIVVALVSNGAQQNCARVTANLLRCRGERGVMLRYGNAADIALDDLEFLFVLTAYLIEHTPAFGQHFGTDSITRKKTNH
jgi:hypothetical protein